MTIIAVVSAIIGVYIVLALIASNITESISAIFDKRGSALYQGIQSLVGQGTKLGTAILNQGNAAPDKTLAQALYDNPLVTSLSGSRNITDKILRRDPQPSYMPARTFTLALLDEIRRNQTTGPDGAPMSLPDLLSTPDALFKDMVSRIGGLPDGDLKQMLTSVVQNADQTYDGLLKSIDSLFDACMRRVSGWYKRWSAVIVAVIGLLLVAALNADTLGIIQQLSNNAAQLQSLSTAAEKLNPSESLDQLVAGATALNLGWTFPKDFMFSWGWLFLKIFGLAISWFAVMLGAPFWFDVLRRLVPVRMTGDIPASGASTQAPDAQQATTS